MKDIDVRFGDGKDVLSAYWGFLADGGLIITDPGFDVGQAVSLNVHIESSESQYLLAGTVVKLDANGRAVVAFDKGEPHDLLLSEALSETDNVPPRRFHRFDVDFDAEISEEEAQVPIKMLNISVEGCCFRLDAALHDSYTVGAPIVLHADGVTLEGTVMWVRNTDRGVKIDEGRSTEDLLALYTAH